MTCRSWNILVFITLLVTGSVVSMPQVELVMPRYAIRYGDVILKCVHSVPLEQLHKVEWLRQGTKIFQYVKGRTPPFKYYKTIGADLNTEHSSEKQVQLSKLDFTASGSYSCVVTTDTPIYTAESNIHELTVIEPQDADPVITFRQEVYKVGEILEANCTSAPARPPPHITWFINQEKVDDKLTKSFSNGRIHGLGYHERTASTTTQLSVNVSNLHAGEDGNLELMCLSTIPGYVSKNNHYADVKKTMVTIDIIVEEVPPEAISSTIATWRYPPNYVLTFPLISLLSNYILSK